jgi:CHAT domain-containing protein
MESDADDSGDSVESVEKSNADQDTSRQQPDDPDGLEDLVNSIWALQSRAETRALCDALSQDKSADELDALAERLKSLRFDHYLLDDMPKARRIAMFLSRLGALEGAPLALGLGFLARADAHRQRSDPVRAMSFFRSAARVFRGAGMPVGLARAQGGWLSAARSASRVTTEDIVAMDEVRAVLREAGEWYRLASVEQNIGLAYFTLGDFPSALAAYDRALEALGDPASDRERLLEAMTLANQARAWTWQNQQDKAFELSQRARARFHELGSRGHAAIQDLNLRGIELERGHLPEALQRADAARAAFQETGNEPAVASALIYRAEILLKLNRARDAADACAEALKTLRRSRDTNDVIDALCVYAEALARLGSRVDALARLSEAETIARDHNEPAAHRIALERATLLLWPHQASDGADHPPETEEVRAANAREARAIAHAMVEIGRAQGARTEHMARLLEAEAALALGDLDAAEAGARQSLGAIAEQANPELTYRGEAVLARVAWQRHDAELALARYDAMTFTLAIFVQELAYDRRSDFLLDKDALYLEAMTAALDAGAPAHALVFLERQRARSVWMANSGGDFELEALRMRHRAVSRDLVGASDDEAEGARRELAQLDVAISERLATQAQRVASLTAFDTQAALAAVPAGATVVAYALTRRELVLFALRDGQLTIARVPEARDQIQDLERRFRRRRESLAHQPELAKAADELTQVAVTGIQRELRELWRLLLTPIEQHLPADGGTLYLVPHALLHILPFAAFFDGQRYAVQRWAIQLLPSCQSLIPSAQVPDAIEDSSGRAAQTPLLALGYVSNADTAPQITREAQRIAAIMGGSARLGSEATGALLRSEAGSCEYLHIAAHGTVRTNEPNSSFVELADGLFHPSDAITLPLWNCQLVTLSACESGLGTLKGGDEAIGLVRAFGLAGACATVATLWRVHDAASRVLMELFYANLSGHIPPARALQAAQRALLTGAAGNTWIHPHYWSGFQLVRHRQPA